MVVVEPRELDHFVLERVIHLLKHHRLVFGSLADLGVLQVFLVGDCPRLSDVGDQYSQLLGDDVFHTLVVVQLRLSAVSSLVRDVLFDLESSLALGHVEGHFDLHVVQNSIDVHESGLVMGPGLNQRL